MTTIATDDPRSILDSADPLRTPTRQAWDLASDDDPAATGTGHSTAMLGFGPGAATLQGLARWAARRDPDVTSTEPHLRAVKARWPQAGPEATGMPGRSYPWNGVPCA